MRSVQDHLTACLTAVGPQPPLEVALPGAVGCVLAEDVVASTCRVAAVPDEHGPLRETLEDQLVRADLAGSPAAGYRADPMGDSSLLLLSTLARATALAVVPEATTDVRAGHRLPCLVLDD